MFRLIIFLLAFTIQVSSAQDKPPVKKESRLIISLPISVIFNKPITSKYENYKYILGFGLSIEKDYFFYNKKNDKISRNGLKVRYVSMSLCRFENFHKPIIDGMEVYAYGMDVLFDFGFSLGPNFRLNPEFQKTPIFFYAQARLGNSIKHSETRYDGWGSSEETHGYNKYGSNLPFTFGLNVQGKKMTLGANYIYNWNSYLVNSREEIFACHMFCFELGIKL